MQSNIQPVPKRYTNLTFISTDFLNESPRVISLHVYQTYQHCFQRRCYVIIAHSVWMANSSVVHEVVHSQTIF